MDEKYGEGIIGIVVKRPGHGAVGVVPMAVGVVVVVLVEVTIITGILGNTRMTQGLLLILMKFTITISYQIPFSHFQVRLLRT